ncbi:uncharacterized protein N0V89_000865 [Didymosphaeria variabile]|uniref:DUF1996 domain-containing protein n=1 Tax=Didymosphaeria variabile TaxID=1932322 RepID=A0A9W9CG38_9PLEO|nr:uncharacterized protein N0V89_000865 [Didymosphaeria variabile]KAJ4360304.1 hypothetical protein N0V89_000865 [Didymosphaeria variabile]
MGIVLVALMATLASAQNTSNPIPGGPSFKDFLRFSCSELNIQRIDPLVTPGVVPSPHLHQFVGGNALAPIMDPSLNVSGKATCTTCTYTEDFSNYWTAVLFFKARNGSFHRVPLMGNLGLERQRGGMTVYYTAPYDKKTKVTAFKPGFRMLIGDPGHSVKLPQVLYETIWDTSAFNDGSIWPADGTQPFVFSMGDPTGYGWHGDYMFGWKGDALQRAMDRYCGTDCQVLETQSIEEANMCAEAVVVNEPIDGWLGAMPGGVDVTS